MKSLGLSLLSVKKIHNHSHLKHGFTPSTPLKGFTIVELLVVIVIIGILAAITIVGYTGITQKAVLASLQSDLSNSSRKLKMYQVEHDTYPASLDSNNCPKDSTGTVDTRYCLKPSSGNTLTYGSSSPYSTFSLTATNVSGISYQVTDNSQPTAIAVAPTVSGNSPVADWLATTQGDHYGNYYNLVSHNWATVTRTGPKTIYDPNDGRIHDVPANYLAMNPWSAYQTGGRGSAAVIEEQRTNYLVNSYFGMGSGLATNWTEPGSRTGSPNYSQPTSALYGNEQRIQYTGIASDSNVNLRLRHITAPATFASGENSTMSVYISGNVSSGVTLQLDLYARNSSDITIGQVGRSDIIPTSTPTLYTLTYPNMPVGTDRAGFNVYTFGINEGSTVDISFAAAQLEKGAFATSYIPTTTTAATRNADVVTVPTTGWNAAAGTFVAVSAGTTGGSLVGSPGIGQFSEGVHKYSPDWSRSAYASSSGGPQVAAATWDAASGNMAAYSDGAGNISSGAPYLTNLADTHIGCWYAVTAFANGPIQRVTIYSSALSSSDVTTVTNAVKNGP